MSFLLDIDTLYKISLGEPYPIGKINLKHLNESRYALLDYLQKEERNLIYGIDTGFGPHAFQNNDDRLKNQLSLVYHLTVTNKDDSLSHLEARAVLAARIHSLCQGGSGISPETIHILCELLELDCIPLIPKKGSLSASGDLIPLSAIALALIGENEWSGKNKEFGPTTQNQKTSKIKGLPKILEPKEALSITNGTSFTTALLALQTKETRQILNQAISYLKILFSFHSVFSDAFLPVLHESKRHKGPVYIANKLYPVVKTNSKVKVNGSRIQDIYSIRCIPHILGSIYDELTGIQETVENELNSLSDNPIYIQNENRFVEGGNFYASHVSFAADRLQNGLAVFGTWLERMIQYLFDPNQNHDFPLMLSPKPGKYAGLSGLGLLATHLTTDIRRDSMPGSVQSIASNGGNQDIVPMGAISVLRNRRSLKNLKMILSIFVYSVFQAASLKQIPLEERKEFFGLEALLEDRNLNVEIDKILNLLENLNVD